MHNPDPSVASLLATGTPLLSYEFFPPKSDEAMRTLRTLSLIHI